MPSYYLKWIGPVLPQTHTQGAGLSVEGLFAWVNEHLSKVGAPILLSNSGVTFMPRFEPKESLHICYALSFENHDQAEDFRTSLWDEHLSEMSSLPYALSFVSEEASKIPKRLCVFDMDSTLIDQEVIDELARMKGVFEEISILTEAAMRGELDFTQSLKARVAYLKGMPLFEARTLLTSLTLSPGADDLLRTLHHQNTFTAVVSGGFDFVLNHFQRQLGLGQVHAHHLLTDEDGMLTGEVEEPIIDAVGKQKFVHDLKERQNCTSAQTIVVGDGANDILMMKEAGLSVSFCGKPKLANEVNTLIFDRNLLWIKHLL